MVEAWVSKGFRHDDITAIPYTICLLAPFGHVVLLRTGYAERHIYGPTPGPANL